jgi:hypothetical protein
MAQGGKFYERQKLGINKEIPVEIPYTTTLKMALGSDKNVPDKHGGLSDANAVAF